MQRWNVYVIATVAASALLLVSMMVMTNINSAGKNEDSATLTLLKSYIEEQRAKDKQQHTPPSNRDGDDVLAKYKQIEEYVQSLASKIETSGKDTSSQLTDILSELGNTKSKITDMLANQPNDDANANANANTDNNNEVDRVRNPRGISPQTEHQMPPRKNVFFDLGANRGDSTAQFVGLEKHSNLGGVTSEQVNQIPLRIKGPWDIYMYEAHPRFLEQIKTVKAQAEALDPAVYGGPFTIKQWNTTAIGWEDGVIDFYLDTRSSVKWGSSILKDHPDVNSKDPNSIIKVPIHNLARKIMENYRISDYVIVKMDIEGIEYDLVTELLLAGAFPFIDELYVEWHGFAQKPENACVSMYVMDLAKKYMKIGGWA